MGMYVKSIEKIKEQERRDRFGNYTKRQIKEQNKEKLAERKERFKLQGVTEEDKDKIKAREERFKQMESQTRDHSISNRQYYHNIINNKKNREMI